MTNLILQNFAFFVLLFIMIRRIYEKLSLISLELVKLCEIKKQQLFIDLPPKKRGRKPKIKEEEFSLDIDYILSAKDEKMINLIKDKKYFESKKDIFLFILKSYKKSVRLGSFYNILAYCFNEGYIVYGTAEHPYDRKPEKDVNPFDINFKKNMRATIYWLETQDKNIKRVAKGEWIYKK